MAEITDPTNVANVGQVYVNDVGGVSELMYQDDAGNETQITSAGALAVTVGWDDALGVDATSGANDPSINTGQKLVGAAELTLEATGANKVQLRTNSADRWNVDASGNLIANTDNSLDIGASGATRPQTAHLGTSAVIAGALTVTGTALSTEGALAVDSTTLSLDGTDDTNLTMTANDAGTKTLTVAATNAGAGVADLDVDADGAVTVDAVGALSLDAGAASNLTTSAGDLTLSAAGSAILTSSEATADAIKLNASDAAGGVDIDAGTGGIDLLTSGAFSIDGTGASNVSATSGNLTLSTKTTGDVRAESADGGQVHLTNNVDIDGAGIFLDASGGLSLDSATNSNFSVSGGTLLVSTAGGGQDLTVSAAGSAILTSSEATADAVRLNASDAAGGVDVDAGTGGVAIDSTGAFSIDGATASNVTVSGASADLTLGARGQTVTLNDASDKTLDTTSTSLVGAINEVYEFAFECVNGRIPSKRDVFRAAAATLENAET